MKKSISYLFTALLISASLLSTSCSKDPKDEPNNPGGNPSSNKDYPAIISGQTTVPPSGYYFTITYPKNATRDWIAYFNFYRHNSSGDFANATFTTYDSNYVFKVTGFNQDYSPYLDSHTAAGLVFTVKPFDMKNIRVGQTLEIMSPYEGTNGVLNSNSLRYGVYKGSVKTTFYQYGWWNQSASGSATVVSWDGSTLVLNIDFRMWTNASTPHYINIKGVIPFTEDELYYVDFR